MMDTQKTTNGLQVIGEGTGIGKSTLHMVGYLGKNCNPVETTAHEYCPVCKEKGQVQVLRTYRINFQESIFLCENPQCIYPLGYKPINSIITSTDSENHQVPSTHKKRKLCDSSDFSPVESHPKKARTNNVVKADHTFNTDPVVKCYQNGFCIPKLNLHDVLQNDKQKLNNNVESCMQKVDFETDSITNIYQESPPETSSPRTQLLPNSELTSASEILLKDDKASTNNTNLCLQWRNTHNLCWLDCILSALVQLETLRFALAEDCSDGKCLLQELLTKYNQATVLLNTCDRIKVKDVLPKAESHLNEIRNRIFTQLQPRLRCKFGKNSPVFALPLLLKLDQQAEKLFLHSFSWKFECLRCGYKYQDRCEKTLTTFTNIIPDWHPLNAFHVGPCNNCSDRSQRRQMILEKIPSILMLHFVEGLPHNNLRSYSFQFGDNCYQITSIVQYQTDKKHFITWSLNPDGTWLECDDLKGPYCKRHTRFEVPPSEIHIVIWEKKTSCVSEELNAQFQAKHIEDLPLNNVQSNSTVLHCGFDIMLDKIPEEHHKEDSVRTPDKKEQQVAEDESGIHDIMVNKILEEHHKEDSVRTPDKKEQQVAEDESGIHDIMVNKIPEEHHREDSVRTPDKKQQQVAEDDTDIHHGLVNLAQDDLVTLILEEIQVDSEGKLLSNGQMVGNNFVGETSTLQQGQLAFSSHSPCEEFAGTGLAMNNKAVLYENSSICLPLEQLNPSNITPSEPKTCDPDPPDSLLAQKVDDNTNFPNTEHGLNSELQLNRKLPPVENIMQKSPDLQDANKIVVNSQVANFTSANNSSQPSHKDQKRGFVGSWVKKLLGKNASFMPSSASALKNERSCRTPSVQKISEVRLPVKGASNFGGFQSRRTNKTTETPKSVAPGSSNTLPLSNFKGFSQSSHLPTASRTATEDPTWNKSGSRLGASGKVTQFRSPPCNSGKAEESDRDKTKRLRLKLLKKLNAKKKKLASLDRLAVEQMQHEKAVSEDVSTPPQTTSHSDSELLQSFLRELQHQIDVAGNESEFNINSVSGCTSNSSSDEILAELLSPTSTVASLEAPKSEDECMYMEMVHSSVTATEPDDTSVPHAAMTGEDHNYYSPVKDGNLELHAISKPSMKKLAFESPTGEDILDDLFSISTPSSVAGDIDLPHFDETLFETW